MFCETYLLRRAFLLGRLCAAISGSIEVEQVGDECRQGAAVFPECNAPVDWDAGHELNDIACMHLVLLVVTHIVLDELTDRLDRKVRRVGVNKYDLQSFSRCYIM